jgi:dephospho-CoA kinase
MPPASIPFSPREIERIFRRMPDEERVKIAKKIQDAEVEVVVTDEQSDKLILSSIADRLRA